MNRNVDLLNDDIRKSLIKLTIPLALTAFIQMAYNLVDAAWIGRIGTDAVAAAGTVGFLMWISQSVVLIPKIGMGIYTSQAYGRENKKDTMQIIKSGVLIAIFLAIIYTIIVLAFKNTYISFYKLGDVVSQYANDYLVIISIGFIFTFLNPVFSQIYNSLGNSMTPFRINAFGLIINLILDPFLIFGIGIFPELGIKGAAIATVFANIFVSLLFTIDIFLHDKLIKEAILREHSNKKWIYRIIKLGTPSAILNGFHAIITIILNKFMAGFGPAPVAVYSIGSQIESISWMTTEGVQVAISSLVGQNYGAGRIERVKKSIKEGLTVVSLIGIFAFFFLFVFRNELFKLFVPNDQSTIALGGKYLLILSLSQFFMAIEIGITGIFNGLSDTRTPSTIGNVWNLMRVPMSLIFMRFFGVLGVWISITISSIFKGLLNIVFLKIKILNSKEFKIS
ncbi:MAG: MATE family efflux transporter [Tissierellia bacterium]|nr:MATE family efflux transporter [Tissierellia bacterium]